MAIVADEARKEYDEWGRYKVEPYNGTPPRTWQNGWAHVIPSGPETPIGFAYEAPTDNRGDDWVPHTITVHTLDKVADTWRP